MLHKRESIQYNDVDDVWIDPSSSSIYSNLTYGNLHNDKMTIRTILSRWDYRGKEEMKTEEENLINLKNTKWITSNDWEDAMERSIDMKSRLILMTD